MQDWKLPRTFESSSGEVRWERFGDVAAPAVVLLHGTPFSFYVWRGVARALAERHQVFVWDMPGYGASAKFAGQDVSLAAQGGVFTELLRYGDLAGPLVVAHVSSASSPGLHPAVLERLVEPWLGEAGQPAFYRQIAQADQRHSDEIQERYGSMDLPVLVCWGQDDAWIPVVRAHELAARIPGAELTLFAGAGHLVQEDAPAELTAAVLRFLA